MRTASQQAGDRAESIVAAHVRAAGWTILARNVHVGRDELDLVAVDPGPPGSLVVVEVRWRGYAAFGLPEETVDWRKRRRLVRAALRLTAGGSLPDGRLLPALPLRFDLVAVEPTPARRPMRPTHLDRVASLHLDSRFSVRLRHYRNAFEA